MRNSTNRKHTSRLGSLARGGLSIARHPQRSLWLIGGLGFAAGVACCYAIFRDQLDGNRGDTADERDEAARDRAKPESALADEVDEAAFESFPASDPPAFNAGSDRAGRTAARRQANAPRPR